MKAVGLTIQACILRVVKDRWRDILFTKTFKGSVGFITTKYDMQETIFPAIISQFPVLMRSSVKMQPVFLLSCDIANNRGFTSQIVWVDDASVTEYKTQYGFDECN